MASQSSDLWEILVPHKIGRKTVHVDYHRVWDDYVMQLVGGMTLMRAAKGRWVSPSTGRTHKELMIPVRISCHRDDILRIMAYTAEYYRQEAVMAYKISEETLILSAEELASTLKPV